MAPRNDDASETCKLKLSTVITIISAVTVILATYFTGQAQSKAYTDNKIEGVRSDLSIEIKNVLNELTEIKIMTARTDQTILERFGRPTK